MNKCVCEELKEKKGILLSEEGVEPLIKIYLLSKIEYNLGIQDLCTENSREREIHLSGITVEFYLNKFIKSSIYIPTYKELTIREIKEEIISTSGYKNQLELLRDEMEKKREELISEEEMGNI